MHDVHEFQTKFLWHLADLRIQNAYVKPCSPCFSEKVERSHRADDMEFYQLLHYTGNVDLDKKLSEWENYYNFDKPHYSLKGKSPYEKLKQKDSIC